MSFLSRRGLRRLIRPFRFARGIVQDVQRRVDHHFGPLPLAPPAELLRRELTLAPELSVFDFLVELSGVHIVVDVPKAER